MIKVSVFYPNTTGSRFDMPYYLNKHIPMVQQEAGCRPKRSVRRTWAWWRTARIATDVPGDGPPPLRLGRSIPTILGTTRRGDRR